MTEEYCRFLHCSVVVPDFRLSSEVINGPYSESQMEVQERIFSAVAISNFWFRIIVTVAFKDLGFPLTDHDASSFLVISTASPYILAVFLPWGMNGRVSVYSSKRYNTSYINVHTRMEALLDCIIGSATRGCLLCFFTTAGNRAPY